MFALKVNGQTLDEPTVLSDLVQASRSLLSLWSARIEKTKKKYNETKKALLTKASETQRLSSHFQRRKGSRFTAV